jgi:hypothetical protein
MTALSGYEIFKTHAAWVRILEELKVSLPGEPNPADVPPGSDLLLHRYDVFATVEMERVLDHLQAMVANGFDCKDLDTLDAQETWDRANPPSTR